MEGADHRARLHQTALRPELLPAQVHQAVTHAMQQGCGAVVVPPVWVQRVVTMTQASGLRVHAVVAFPHGTNKSTVKAIEATSCIKDGAQAVCVVPHLPHLIRGDVDALKFELLETARAARAARRDVAIHLFVESALLARANPNELATRLAAACRAARESGCDGVVSDGGFLPSGGATVERLAMLRDVAEGLAVTAAGGVESAENVRELRRAGADVVWSERAAEIAVELTPKA
jgi:deoxyribose-phosphate aldolase